MLGKNISELINIHWYEQEMRRSTFVDLTAGRTSKMFVSSHTWQCLARPEILLTRNGKSCVFLFFLSWDFTLRVFLKRYLRFKPLVVFLVGIQVSYNIKEFSKLVMNVSVEIFYWGNNNENCPTVRITTPNSIKYCLKFSGLVRTVVLTKKRFRN